MSDLLIKNGEVFQDGSLRRLNLGITGGRVSYSGHENPPAGRVFDATGRWILPGMIDTHVHFREPGRTDKEDFGSGTLAAAAGGVTTVLEIQNNEPMMADAAILREKHSVVSAKARVNYGLYANVGLQNLDRLDELAPEAAAFKVFMTQSVGPLTVTGLGDLWKAFAAVARTGKVLAVHAEADAICKTAREGLPDHVASHSRARPALAEAVAVGEALELCAATGCPVNLAHLSTARAVDRVAEAKRRGLPVSAATCPHYLVFTDEAAAAGGNAFKVNPSIKSAADRDALLEGVRSGVIDHVHSDHAPHTPAEKAKSYREAPSGIAGIQHQLLVLLELAAAGKLALADVVRAAAEGPAAAFGLDRRGRIAPGWAADLVIVDPSAPTRVQRVDLLSRAADSPWVGHVFPHRIAATIVAGRVVWAEGRPEGELPGGVRVA